MTPEERMERLKNADRWTVNEVRADLGRIPRRRPARFVVPVVSGLVAVAVAAALVVGAVTLRSNQVHPAIAPSPSPTPTATADPGAITGIAPPNQPFAGNCSAMASIAAMSDAAGSTVSVASSLTSGASAGGEPQYGFVSTAESNAWAFAQRQSGGLECAWAAGKKAADLEYIDVVAYPASVVSARGDQNCGTVPPSESGPHTTDCAISITVNGVLFNGTVQTSSLATSRALAAKLVALWTASAEGAPTFAASPAAPGSWSLSIDCSATSVADIDGAAWTLANTPTQGDTGPSGVVDEIIGGHAALYCTAASANQAQLLYSVYGGGAWVFDEAVAKFGATAVDVPGFDHAAILHSPDGQKFDFVLMTRGSNLLAVLVSDYLGTKKVTAAETYPVSVAVANALDDLTKTR